MSTGTEHVDSVRTYAVVWIVLLILTGVTTAVAYVDLGHLNVVAALSIAVGKMLLVALYFMHVRHSAQLTRLVVAGGLLWLAILITLTMADIVTRGWIGVPGR
jgi:cytochrome c oxidase subunit 4